MTKVLKMKLISQLISTIYGLQIHRWLIIKIINDKSFKDKAKQHVHVYNKIDKKLTIPPLTTPPIAK